MDQTLPPTPDAAEGADPGARAAGVQFTEEMKGFITLGETDFERGFKLGKKAGTACMFHLTIKVDDVAPFVADPRHLASAVGWVESEVLGGRLPVEQGLFNLFVPSDDPAMVNMLYRLYFADGAGNPLTLSGHKNVKDDPGFDLWSDTSTLYTHILKGHVDAAAEPSAEVVAAGIIHIHLTDFAHQLTTFRTHGPSREARNRALADFGKLFLGKLWDIYGPKAHEAASDG